MIVKRFKKKRLINKIKNQKKKMNILLLINAVLINCLFIKESKKKVPKQVPKNNKQHNSFNTDNKSSY